MNTLLSQNSLVSDDLGPCIQLLSNISQPNISENGTVYFLYDYYKPTYIGGQTMDYSSSIIGIILGLLTLKKVMQHARDPLPLILLSLMLLNSLAVFGGAIVISLYHSQYMSSPYHLIGVMTAQYYSYFLISCCDYIMAMKYFISSISLSTNKHQLLLNIVIWTIGISYFAIELYCAIKSGILMEKLLHQLNDMYEDFKYNEDLCLDIKIKIKQNLCLAKFICSLTPQQIDKTDLKKLNNVWQIEFYSTMVFGLILMTAMFVSLWLIRKYILSMAAQNPHKKGQSSNDYLMGIHIFLMLLNYGSIIWLSLQAMKLSSPKNLPENPLKAIKIMLNLLTFMNGAVMLIRFLVYYLCWKFAAICSNVEIGINQDGKIKLTPRNQRTDSAGKESDETLSDLNQLSQSQLLDNVSSKYSMDRMRSQTKFDFQEILLKIFTVNRDDSSSSSFNESGQNEELEQLPATDETDELTTEVYEQEENANPRYSLNQGGRNRLGLSQENQENLYSSVQPSKSGNL